MNTDIKWGRGIGFVPHRIQHAWIHGILLVTLCGGVVSRGTGTVDYESDAARCERCAARLKRLEAEA